MPSDTGQQPNGQEHPTLAAQKRDAAPGNVREVHPDKAWARKNLRSREGKLILDIANVIRILERHEDFKGRFQYNETLNKVLDKGTVMLDWRIAECCAVIQERFLPEISDKDVEKALVIVSNRTGVRK